MTQLTKDDILSELAKALQSANGERPSRAEGWRSIAELVEEGKLNQGPASEAVIRRRMAKLNGRLEKQRHGPLMYYRLKP